MAPFSSDPELAFLSSSEESFLSGRASDFPGKVWLCNCHLSPSSRLVAEHSPSLLRNRKPRRDCRSVPISSLRGAASIAHGDNSLYPVARVKMVVNGKTEAAAAEKLRTARNRCAGTESC